MGTGCHLLWQLAQPREKQCDLHTLGDVPCFHLSLSPPFIMVHNPLPCRSTGAVTHLIRPLLLLLFMSNSVLCLCDGCRCCCQCVRKCRKALMTKCPGPCLWLCEAGPVDALMLEADVSTLKCWQCWGVCGGAAPPSACAAAAVVPAATVWLRVL